MNKNGSVSRVAGFGHKGLVEYIGEAYQDWTYEKMDFEGDLKVLNRHSNKIMKACAEKIAFEDDVEVCHR